MFVRAKKQSLCADRFISIGLYSYCVLSWTHNCRQETIKALCLMPYALCIMPYALCIMPYALWIGSCDKYRIELPLMLISMINSKILKTTQFLYLLSVRINSIQNATLGRSSLHRAYDVWKMILSYMRKFVFKIKRYSIKCQSEAILLFLYDQQESAFKWPYDSFHLFHQRKYRANIDSLISGIQWNRLITAFCTRLSRTLHLKHEFFVRNQTNE